MGREENILELIACAKSMWHKGTGTFKKANVWLVKKELRVGWWNAIISCFILLICYQIMFNFG